MIDRIRDGPLAEEPSLISNIAVATLRMRGIGERADRFFCALTAFESARSEKDDWDHRHPSWRDRVTDHTLVGSSPTCG